MSSDAPALSFADLAIHHGRSRPEKPAIIIGDRVVSYGMVAQAIVRIEQRIRGLGLKAGGLVCISIDNPIRHLIVAAALFRAGHPVMSVTRTLDVPPLALPVNAFIESPSRHVLIGQYQVLADDTWFQGDDLALPPDRATGDAHAICRVELSSGTTGRPKAISLTHAAFNASISHLYHTLGQGSWDRLLCLPGLANNWGFTVAAHTLFAGRTLAFAESPRAALHMMSLYGCDALVASGQHLRELVREKTTAPIPLAYLRVVMTGGSLISQKLLADARGTICGTIINQYGSTEGGITAYAPADRLAGVEGATGYVGPWARVEVVDNEDRPIAVGSEGLLRVRGAGAGEVYPPGRPDPGFRDGWFYPGDRGKLTPDGLLVVTGRASDLINAGGAKIAPELIEDVLRSHPLVQDAAAFGATGEAGLEEVVAAVVPRAALEVGALSAWCSERGYAIARIVVIESVPKTATGKVQRDLLKQQLAG